MELSNHVYVIKDFERGKKGKKGKGKAGRGGKKGAAGKKGGGKGAKGGKGKKDREGFSTEPKPAPLTADIENPDMTTDKGGIERILKLVTVYDDPDYGGCTISGLLSNDILLHAIKKTHLIDSVLRHPCTLVAKHTGRIIGICLCTDRNDSEWDTAWDSLKTTFPPLADRDAILNFVYKGEKNEAGKTCVIHQLSVDTKFRRMTVGTQLVRACLKNAESNNYHRVSILCTDEFSAMICKKLKFKKQGEPLHYKKFNHPRTGRLIYKCIYKKPHRKMQHYAIRF